LCLIHISFRRLVA